jgi:hypothetical protein
MDTDGHGRVGRAQLRWLDAQLAEAAALREQVRMCVRARAPVPV